MHEALCKQVGSALTRSFSPSFAERKFHEKKIHEKIFFVFKIAMAVKIVIPDSLMNLFGRMVHSGN